MRWIGVSGAAISLAHPLELIESSWEAPPTRVPSADLVDGPLLGNGRLGAVAAWTDEAHDSDAVPSWDGGEEEAGVAFHLGHNSFFAAPTSGISSCGYTDITQGGRKALGGISLRFRIPGARFSVKQRPGNATVALSLDSPHGLLNIEAFIHAHEDVLALKIQSDKLVEARAIVWTYAGCDPQSDPSVNRVLPVMANASEDGIEVSRATGWPFQNRGIRKVERFHMRMHQLAGDFKESGKREHCGDGKPQGSPRGPCASGRFSVGAGEEVVLRLDVLRTALRGPEPAQPSRSREWREMMGSHQAAWSAYWAESYLEMPSSPLSEHFWYTSQYLLRASSAGDAAPGLYGPFVTTDRPRWMGDLVLNYNAEATYYGAASSNHAELLEPYVQTILDYIPEGRLMAQRQFPNCEGAIHFPAKILPHGVTSADNGDMGQKQAAIFASVPLIHHWQHFRNLTFAKRVHEFLVGVATFWTGCALADGGDGFLHDDEDCFEELCDGTDENQRDPTMVLAFLPHLLETTSQITELLEAENSSLWGSARVTAWRAAASKIAPYARVDPVPEQLDSSGAKEVIADYVGARPDSTWGGPFATWPLGSIGLGSDDCDLALGRRSMDNFVRVYPAMRMSNGFVHSFAAAARLNWRPDVLLQYWEAFLSSDDERCRMYANGLVDGCGHTGLENVGATAFLNELMLQSHEGMLRLFPALPSGLPGAFKLRAVGGLVVEARRLADGHVRDVSVTVDDAPGLLPLETCSMVNPWPSSSAVLVDGVVHEVSLGVLTFAVTRGHTHYLEPGKGDVQV